MAAYESVSEALAHVQDATALCLDADELQKPMPASLNRLQRVTRLEVRGPDDASLSFPAALFALPITDLELRNFRVHEIFPFKGLDRLTLVNHYVQDDVLPLCRTLTALEHLEIWGYHAKRALELPPEVQNLTALQSLTIVSCAMQALPRELATLTSLKAVALRANRFPSFPPALAAIPGLERLELSHGLASVELPEVVADMQTLRELDLSGNFSTAQSFEEELDEMIDDREDRGIDLPALLGRLTGLEALNLAHSNIRGIGALAALTGLRRLRLNGGLFADLTPLAALTRLEELDLSSCYALRDLAPIAKLQALKKLSLEQNHSLRDLAPLTELRHLAELNIEGCSDVASLTPILSHPSLATLEADDEVMESWARRATLATLPSVEEIARLLAATDAARAERGLGAFVTWVELNSSRDANAAPKLLGVDVRPYGDERVIPLPAVSQPITRFARELSRDTLVGVVRALLNRITDNFGPVLDATRLLIARADVAGQQEVVRVFQKACAYYDAGHRFQSSTVHDQLIDDLLPQFHGDALALLLAWCADDYLMNDMGLDSMDTLFAPAFATVRDAGRRQLLIERFTTYIEGLDSDYLEERSLLEEVEAASPLGAEVARRLRAERAQGDAAAPTPAATEEDAGTDDEAAPTRQPAAPASGSEAVRAAFNATDADESPDVYIALVARLAQVTDQGKRDMLIAEFFYNRHNVWLRGGQYDLCKRLLTAYVALLPLVGQPKSMMSGATTGSSFPLREAIAGDALALWNLSKDDAVWPLIETLLPEKVTMPALAYNLACSCALKGKKDKLLTYVRLCLDLGKRKPQFMADSDFAAYKDDPEFLALFD